LLRQQAVFFWAGAGDVLAQSPDGSSNPRPEATGRQYCVTCYGQTNDMTSKRTCYQIKVPTQVHMRAFGVRQCTVLSGNFWYQFAVGSCEGKNYCKEVIER
jgi:hypothetical protein